MAAVNSQDLPEVFIPEDAKWASRAAARGEIRRLARGRYSTNLDEPVEQLVRRRWADVAALYFPGAVVVDRSAVLAAPTPDGLLFLDSGPVPARPRPVELPGLSLRPRSGPGHVAGDMPFVKLWMSSPARAFLDNMRPSRALGLATHAAPGGARAALGPDRQRARRRRAQRAARCCP